MNVSVIIPAAGLGTRMGREKSGVSRKQFMLLDGAPILVHTIRKFLRCASVKEIVIALRAEDIDWARELVSAEKPTTPVRVVEGGDSRQASVENALATLAPGTELVAVHDAVRPFIDPEIVEKVIAEAAESGAAIVGIVPVDTVKQIHRKDKIKSTLPREHLVLAQTPQVFRFELLKEAFASARADQFTGTDEASLVERLERVDVSVVQGSDRNIKITKPNDMELAHLYLAQEREVSEIRTGLGWDTHRLSWGLDLILGGVRVPSDRGQLGHSDADVLSHAITDALLGAAALGDIGMLFPDTDPQWKGADSAVFLTEAVKRVRAAGFTIVNIDSTVILEKPKLKDFRLTIRETLARTIGIDSGPRLREVQDRRRRGSGRRTAIQRSAGNRYHFPLVWVAKFSAEWP